MEAESLFAQTVRELDDAFYATFPDAAQTAQQLRLYTCYYHGPGDSNEVPTLEYAYQSSPIINNRPHHALHPAHSYHHFSARHARVRPDQPPQRGPPPLEKVHHQTHPSGPVGTQISDKPNKQQLLSLDSDKKPFLACLFCRTRKIVCGVPLPGYPDKTCGCVLLSALSASTEHPVVNVSVDL